MRSGEDDRTAIARIRDAAIDQFGRRGFGVSVRAIAEAAEVSPALVIHHFGTKDKLRLACEAYIAEQIRATKTESLTSADPTIWFAQLAEMESYAPMVAYLVRSMQTGGELGRALLRQMVDNTEAYIGDGVRAGTIKPSRDPKARARFLAMTGAGALLLYLSMHENPTDMRAVLHDYAQDMVLPALELYTEGLLADSTMFDAFVARADQGTEFATSTEGSDQGGTHARNQSDH